jgi:hypothetical protein
MSATFYPSTIVQYAQYPDNNVSWTNNSGDVTIVNDLEHNFELGGRGPYISVSNSIIQTSKSLTHIANPTRGPKLDKTFYLKCTNFQIDTAPSDITGFSLSLKTQRHQRIVDDTIALIYDDKIISKNKTNLSTRAEGHLRNENDQGYGGLTDLWGIKNFTPSMLEDPSFGVLLRFSSNPLYPHRDGMMIYQIGFTTYTPLDTAVLTQDIFVFDNEFEYDPEENIEPYFIPE